MPACLAHPLEKVLFDDIMLSFECFEYLESYWGHNWVQWHLYLPYRQTRFGLIKMGKKIQKLKWGSMQSKWPCSFCCVLFYLIIPYKTVCLLMRHKVSGSG